MIPFHQPPVILDEGIRGKPTWPSLLMAGAVTLATLFALALFVLTVGFLSYAMNRSPSYPWILALGASLSGASIGSVWLLDRRSHPWAASSVAVGVFLASSVASGPLFVITIELVVSLGSHVIPPWAYIAGLVLVGMELVVPWGLWTKRPWAWFIMALEPWANPIFPLSLALVYVFAGGPFGELYLNLCVLPTAILFASLAVVAREFFRHAAKRTASIHGL